MAGLKGAAVIMNPVNVFIPGLVGIPYSRKEMYFVALALKGAGKLCNMASHAPHTYGMHGFPRKKCNTHLTPFLILN